ncbi:hypothetical protein [uncultured Aquimarina sp.]|uniref:hypothetical protein n=1 Tax=uncultured Aquimarina sp. TaxID=575652 RepID=UPI002613D812|nr:hypothetical protein [uncultured Aquimarina sp.]
MNIRYDLPKEVWEKIEIVYAQMPGWLGFGKDGEGEEGIPYWFSFKEEEKYIVASIEPSGLQFEGYMDEEDWLSWKILFKKVATEVLGFKVGEIEEGEVGGDIEWIK